MSIYSRHNMQIEQINYVFSEIHLTINHRCCYLVLGVDLREATVLDVQADLREAVK